MAGLILIVDDLSLNRTVLCGKLASACYRTITANGGAAALRLLHEHRPDLVLLDYHMPDMDGLAVCQAMRADPATRDIPVILFSANSDHEHRLGALAAGADDFMSKPLDETYLLGRIRSLLRNVARHNEWRDHPNTALQTGLAESAAPFTRNPRMSIVTGHADTRQGWLSSMAAIWPEARLNDITVPAALGMDDPRQSPDLFVITPDAMARSGLHVIAELRSRTATRHAEICLILPPDNRADAAMALDLGAADILMLPLDRAETRLRLEKVVAQKLRSDAQRRTLENQLGLAAFDPLTGLHNRSHGLAKLAHLVAQTQSDVALLLIDLDRFKSINDRHGHNAGDEILRQVAHRMRQDLRHDDILCRYGGEEFLLAMPEASLSDARQVAERLCARIGDLPYTVPGSEKPLHVTASVGISLHGHAQAPVQTDELQRLIEASDAALRCAKQSGRNRVVSAHSVTA